MSKVACERSDGLLVVHPEEQTCEVCGPTTDPDTGYLLFDSQPPRMKFYDSDPGWEDDPDGRA